MVSVYSKSDMEEEMREEEKDVKEMKSHMASGEPHLPSLLLPSLS